MGTDVLRNLAQKQQEQQKISGLASAQQAQIQSIQQARTEQEAKEAATKELRKVDIPGYGHGYATKVQQQLSQRLQQLKSAVPTISQVKPTIDTTNYVQLSTKEYVDKTEFSKLSPEDQVRLKELGITGFNNYYQQQQAKFLAENIKLNTGEYIPKVDYDKLDTANQNLLMTKGVKAFNDYQAQQFATFKVNNTQLGTGEWVSKTEYNKLPPEWQQQLLGLGTTGFNNWIKTAYPGSTGLIKVTDPLTQEVIVYGATNDPNIGLDAGGNKIWIGGRWPDSVKTAMPKTSVYSGAWPEEVSTFKIVPIPTATYTGASTALGGTWGKTPETLAVQALSIQAGLAGVISNQSQQQLQNSIASLQGESLARYNTALQNIQSQQGTAAQKLASYSQQLQSQFQQAIAQKTIPTFTDKQGNELVLLGTGEYILKDKFNSFDVRVQAKVLTEGISGAIDSILGNYKTKDGYDVVSFLHDNPNENKTLEDLGFAKDAISEAQQFIKDNVRVGINEWMPHKSNSITGTVGFDDLPKLQQDILITSGMNGLKEKVNEWETSLSNFTIKDSEGKVQGYDLVSAKRLIDGGYDKVLTLPENLANLLKKYKIEVPEGLYKLPWLEGVDKGKVKEAISGLYKPEVVQTLTAGSIIVPKDTWEKLQVFSEETASQKSIDYWSTKDILKNLHGLATIGQLEAVDVYKMSPTEQKNYLEGIQKQQQSFNNTVNKLKVEKTDIPFINKAITEIFSTSEKAKSIISKLPQIIAEKSAEAKAFLKTAPEDARYLATPASWLLGVGDLLITVPTGMVSSFAKAREIESKAAIALTKEEHDKLVAETNTVWAGLGTGMISWFAGLPYAIKSDPWIEAPYALGMLKGAKGTYEAIKGVEAKVMPGMHSTTVLSLENHLAQAPVPKTMTSSEARFYGEIIEKAWMKQGLDASKQTLETRKATDVVLRDPVTLKEIAIGHATAFQQAVAGVTFHVSPDAFKSFNEALSPKGKGYIEIAGAETNPNLKGAPGMFSSQQVGWDFIVRNSYGTNKVADPAILAKMHSLKDIGEMPPEVLKLWQEDKPGAARTLFQQMAIKGKLEPKSFPVWKIWNNRGIPTLEMEFWDSPNMKWYPMKAPWYAKKSNINTATTTTINPIDAPQAGLRSGAEVPVLWVASENALKEGRTMPALSQLYKAELLDFVTTARKMMPWNVKLNKFTIRADEAATSSMLASKFTGLILKEKEPLLGYPGIVGEFQKGKPSITKGAAGYTIYTPPKPITGKGKILEDVIVTTEGKTVGIKTTETTPTTTRTVYDFGDIHGEWNRINQSLKDFKVVDNKGNWVGGNTRINFLGDLTDRGTSGTSVLKNVIELQKQAELAGGKVDVILGNHDAMILAMSHVVENLTPEQIKLLKRYSDRTSKDYKSPELYKKLSSSGIHHVDRVIARTFSAIGGSFDEAMFIAKNPEVRAWLEKRPAMTKSGEDLLIHADNGKFYMTYGKTIEEVNIKVAEMLKTKEGAAQVYHDINRKGQRHFAGTGVGAILSQFDAKRVVHGHTPTKSGKIEIYKEGRAINVNDVDYYVKKQRGQAFKTEEIISNLPEIKKGIITEDIKATIEPTGELKVETKTEAAQVPVMITRKMEADLKSYGYTQAQIDNMKPQEAWDILKVAEKVAEEPTIIGKDMLTDSAPIKVQHNSFEGLTEVDIDGNIITLTELHVKKSADNVYINGNKVTGTNPLNYGDYIRIGDKGIYFIPKEASAEGFAKAAEGFKEAVHGKEGYGGITAEAEKFLKNVLEEGGIPPEKPTINLRKIARQNEIDPTGLSSRDIIQKLLDKKAEYKLEREGKATGIGIPKEAQEKIDKIVNKVNNKAEERAAKGEKYEDAFMDEAQKMGDKIVENFERYDRKDLPYRLKTENMILPLLPELRRDIELKRQESIRQYTEARDYVANKARSEARSEAQRERITSIDRVEESIRQEPRIRERIRTEPRIESRVEPRTEARIRTEIRPEVRTELRTEPRAEIRVEPRISTRTEPRVPLRQEPRIPPREEIRPIPRREIRREPIKYPPIKPVIAKGHVESFSELTPSQEEASIAWKQGWAYHLIYPPWNAQNVLHSKEPFPGVKIHTGIGSASKSLAQVKGEALPDKILWDLGIVDITFAKGYKNKVGMTYKSDVGDKNKIRKPIGAPTVAKVKRVTVTPSISGVG